MDNQQVSTKHVEIIKANSSIFAIVAVCAVVSVFALMASRALLQQRSYENRVIAAKKKALNQLKANNTAAQALVVSYKAFVGTPETVIGGSSTGTGERDGDNAKIILDALPSKYDFPALASSLEKILTSGNYTVNSITGTDDEVNQERLNNDSSKPVDMPFEISATGNYQTVQSLIQVLEKSIRPFSVSTLNFKGTDDRLTIVIDGKTYYLPARTLDIKKQEVR
jgi:hypothetical protein